MTSKEMALIAAKALDDKKARDIVMLEVRSVTVLAEYMLIATGTSDPHLRSLCDEVEKKMDEAGEPCRHREGYRGDTWVVMDFAGVMVHVFTQEQRKFYDLERLWGDAPVIPLDEYLRPE